MLVISDNRENNKNVGKHRYLLYQENYYSFLKNIPVLGRGLF